MKKLSYILHAVFAVLVAIVALVFVVIEGRLLFSGDWMLYFDPVVGCYQVVARLMIALLALAVAVCDMIFCTKRNFLLESVIVLACSVVLIFTASNYFGLYFSALALLYLASVVFLAKVRPIRNHNPLKRLKAYRFDDNEGSVGSIFAQKFAQAKIKPREKSE